MTAVDRTLLDQAVAWTRAAGELTLGWFNHTELTIDAKGDGSPVTQADRAAERIHHVLHPVADPQHRYGQVKNGGVDFRTVLFVDAGRTA